MAKKGEIKGMDKLLKELKSLGKDGIKAIAKTTHLNANEIALKAKTALQPYIDRGQLIGSVKVEPVNDLTDSIGSDLPYAGFIEFGTGVKTEIPTEMNEVAARFRGKGGGSFKEGLQMIKEWCRRKGIDENAAYPIFVNLLTNGQTAKPFLYPAYKKQIPIYIKDLKEDLKRLTSKI